MPNNGTPEHVHIMHISGGLGSGAAWLRLLDRGYNCPACFADTRNEHADLYRFLADLETHTGRQITRIENGDLNTWQWFRKKRTFTNRGACIASYYLKAQPLRAWMAQHYPDPERCTIYMGFGPDELDRLQRMQTKLAPYTVDSPLHWDPPLWFCDTVHLVQAAGIRTPDLYDEGFSHNNCGGQCILGGIQHWAHLWRTYPDRFRVARETEEWLIADRASRGYRAFTILRRRENKESIPYRLSELEADLEAGRRLPPDLEQKACSCATL